jgi:acetyl-CoA carboxylase carboxyl transferase subunit alpha
MQMLQYATYSVISPEGCASILWKSADMAPTAAEAMGITAERLFKLDLVDAVIPEPMGGAHRDMDAMATALKASLLTNLATLNSLSIDQLVAARYARLMHYGQFEEN